MMRILAVDDDPVILDLLTGCLTENDNYELTCCESSEEALEICRNRTNRSIPSCLIS